MTRIFTDGAEMRDTLFWTGASSLTVQSSTPAFSTYYYYGVEGTPYKYFTPLSEFYFRMRYRDTQITYGGRVMPCFRNGSTNIAWIGPNGSYPSANTSAGRLVTSTVILNSNQWYLYEVYFKLADAPNGRFVLKVDGTIIIDYTGDTKPTSTSTIDNIYLAANGSGNLYCDDLALNDTDNSDGKNDNSWCGDGIITKITPSGSGTTNNWLNSGSVSGSANYLYVDEYPSDSDTTYVYCSGSNTGFQDQYEMSDISLAGKTITRIYSESRAKKTLAETVGLKIGYLPAGGTDQLSGSSTLTLSYARIVGTDACINPVTSASWVESDISALEYVAEIA
jgi:hypothetical protein